ncbi:MAG: helix-turn-helix domain-containing protein [Deltaproteobacteria bacterium]|nr:helix-turn-helix domain-containing protein [Deltaproteobacteria bacterium]
MNQDSEQIETTTGIPRLADQARAQANTDEPTGEVPSDLRALLLARWNALGEETFNGDLVDDRRLSDIGRDSELLATVTAWFRTKGNITRAAQRIRSSRRTLRERIKVWRKIHPDFVPAEVKKASGNKAPAPGESVEAKGAPEESTT